MKVMDRKGSRFAFLQEKIPWTSMEKLKAGLIWWLSNKRTLEELYVWWTTEKSWIVHLAVSEVSSYKLPGKPLECRIWEGNWRATHEFLPTQCMSNCSLCAHTWTIFQRTVEIWVKSRWALSSRHFHYGRALARLMGCKLSPWLLLVLKTRCNGCQAQEEVLEKTFHL